jgi:hypothetical protein
MPAVHAEIVIGGQQQRGRERLGHTHERHVGETRAMVYIFGQQLHRGLEIVGQIERQDGRFTRTARALCSRDANAIIDILALECP